MATHAIVAGAIDCMEGWESHVTWSSLDEVSTHLKVYHPRPPLHVARLVHTLMVIHIPPSSTLDPCYEMRLSFRGKYLSYSVERTQS